MTRFDMAAASEPANRVAPGKVSATLSIQEVRLRAISHPALSHDIFTLSDSWGRQSPSTTKSVLGSVLSHALIIGAIVAFSLQAHKVVSQAQPVQRVTLIAPSIESYVLPLAIKQAGGGGGGGDRDKIQAPRGALPRAAKQQITPPAIFVRNEHPKLTAEPTVVAPQQIQIATSAPNLGVPSAPVVPSLASNGTGSGGGIGSGSGGGVGKGSGPGVGEGYGGGTGGGAYKVGGSVLAPRPLEMPDPDYTEPAREAKLQGMCVLGLIVGADGKPREIHVIRKLGLGLDERAIAAVSQWTFAPATKDGTPVPVQISVQVVFKLN